MAKLDIPFIEIELAEACNLSCEGCTNYSDYVHGGWLSWAIGSTWITPWLDRVNIKTLSLIGGEPLLNPELGIWLLELRKLLPDTHIQVVTNGILIHKHPAILDYLYTIGNSTLDVSAHLPKDPNFLKSVDLVVKYPNWQKNSNFLKYNGQTNYFLKTYRGDFKTMKPYNSEPTKAFAICCQQTCPLIHQGKLYKCSSIAKLPMVLSDWGHLNDPDWQNYLSYQGLSSDCSDLELSQWIDNYGKPAKICQMCPDISQRPMALVDHRTRTWTKSDMRLIPIRS